MDRLKNPWFLPNLTPKNERFISFIFPIFLQVMIMTHNLWGIQNTTIYGSNIASLDSRPFFLKNLLNKTRIYLNNLT